MRGVQRLIKPVMCYESVTWTPNSNDRTNMKGKYYEEFMARYTIKEAAVPGRIEKFINYIKI